MASEIFKEAKRLESKYSYFLPDSIVSRINDRASSNVTLDDESYEIIQKTLLFCKDTNFVFDIAKAGALKNAHTAQSQAFASSKHIQLSANELIFSNQFTKIDLGGVIKEYAVDRARDILIDAQIDGALVDFGGDICALGTKNGNKWKIGVKNPKNPKVDIAVVELENMCIATSGHYERKGHIATQENGSKYIQASCVGKSAMEAGIFSTAFLVGGSVSLPPTLSAVLIDERLNVDTLDARAR